MATNHMSTDQAKHQGLPGSDVFRYSHLLYHDPLNRDAGVVHLNVEAYKSFSDTVLLTQRHALAAEQSAAKEWLAAGGFASNIPFPWALQLMPTWSTSTTRISKSLLASSFT